MEQKIRKKRTQSASKLVQPASDEKSNNQPASTHTNSVHSVLGIPLDPKAARQAIILSEIIGKPVSKRARRR